MSAQPKITERLAESAFAYIKSFIALNGYSPTFEQIKNGAGGTSRSMVRSALGILQMQGRITYTPYLARTIRITEEFGNAASYNKLD